MSRDNERVRQRTQDDTERAGSRTNRNSGESRNTATERDTNRAAERTNRSGVGGTEASRAGGAHSSFEQREAEAGLYLAGNDPMSGRRGDSSADAAESYEQRSGSAVQRALNPVVENVGSRLENINFESANNPLVDSGGGAPWLIYLANGTTLFVTESNLYDNFDDDDDWSIELGVSGSGFDGTFEFNGGVDLFDDDPQTFYRLPIIRDEINISLGGSYRETIVCVNGKPIVQLVKIS